SRRVQRAFAQPGVSQRADKGMRPAEVVGAASARHSRTENIMSEEVVAAAAVVAEAVVVGTEPCILEPRPHIWDLGGTMIATFADKSNPNEPVGFINSDQVLEVTVTVTLT